MSLDGDPREGLGRESGIHPGYRVGIAALQSRDGAYIAGMGIVVDSWHVVTCAHVVNAALGLSEKEQDQPGDCVKIVFPFTEPRIHADGEVLRWYPFSLSDQPFGNRVSDIAVLRLSKPVPESVGSAQFSLSRDLIDHPIRVFGARIGVSVGDDVQGRIAAELPNHWYKLVGKNSFSGFVQQGFSGAGVWDEQARGLAGMAALYHDDPNMEVAYMIPTSVICTVLPHLEPIYPITPRLEEYLSALSGFLSSDLKKEPEYFSLSFQPRSVPSREALSLNPSLSLNNIIEQHDRCAIIGIPGSGKTRALKDLAHSLCEDAKHHIGRSVEALTIPVYVSVRHLKACEDQAMRWYTLVFDVINSVLAEHGFHLDSGDDLVALLRGHHAVFLLDGLNEIEGETANAVLDSLRCITGDAKIVVSSRVREYPSERSDYLVFQVRELEWPTEVKAFINVVAPHFRMSTAQQGSLISKCTVEPSVRRLASNPFMLCRLCEATVAGMLPGLPNKFDLLHALCERAVDPPLNPGPAHHFLAELAREMHVSRQLYLTLARARDIEAKHGSRVIAKLKDSNLILICSDQIAFSHQIVQEFYCGLELIGRLIRNLPASLPYGSQELSGKARLLDHDVDRIREEIGPLLTNAWYLESTALCLQKLQDLLTRPSYAKVLAWVQQNNPHLTASVVSILPMGPCGNADGLCPSLLPSLSRRARLWVLWGPNLYPIAPFAVCVTILLAAWFAVPWAGGQDWHSLVGERLPVWGQLLVGLFLVGPALVILYYRLLSQAYSRFDEFIFDRVVRHYLTSLEMLKWNGGDEALFRLRLSAEHSRYIGDRMRDWICSASTVKITEIPCIYDRLPKADRLAVIRRCPRNTGIDSINVLFRLFEQPDATRAERREMIAALKFVLDSVNRGDPRSVMIERRLGTWLNDAAYQNIHSEIGRVTGMGRASRWQLNWVVLRGWLRIGRVLAPSLAIVSVFYWLCHAFPNWQLFKFGALISAATAMLTVVKLTVQDTR